MVHIAKTALRDATLALLALPTFVFLLTWVKPAFSIPAVLLLAVGCYCGLSRERRRRRTDQKTDMPAASDEQIYLVSVPTLLVIAACALLWTFFAGQGGYFFQSEDHFGRNAVLHDLLSNAWPVRFEGTSYALTYYLNYWIVPAALGKAGAALLALDPFAVANAALFCQTAVLLALLFFMMSAYFKIRGWVTCSVMLGIFVFFRGMDILGAALNNDLYHQIEWWMDTFQFSSHTTALFWVYNQAVPAWLVTMLLLQERDVRRFALLGMLLLPYSPMPLVGVAAFMAGLAARFAVSDARERGMVAAAKGMLRDALSPANACALAALLPIFYCYFASNRAVTRYPFRFDIFLPAFGPTVAISRLLLF